jgi:hypothetical protein
MTTGFSLISGSTVPQDYSWDIGLPFTPGITESEAYSTIEYISGYAPGLKVLFRNDSIPDTSSEFNIDYLDYSWNFGDYYNYNGNFISLSCVVPVEHIFIMPGKYSVSLTQTQTTTETVVDAPPDLCLDKYNLNWYWTKMECVNLDSKTWDDTKCTSPTFPKWWDNELVCFQKYCKFWSWERLKCTDTINRVKWEETATGGQFEKRWFFENNDTVCGVPEFLTFTNTQSQTITKQYIVEVKEIMPKARLHSVTQPPLGNSGIAIQLSPQATKCGSFPIDRIDWDFGDGSPIKTVTRQGNNLADVELFNNNIFSGDPLDPRNFDALHTYNRSADMYTMFYPSITAFSANTGTFDSCSTTVGPISLPAVTPNEVKLVKSKNTVNGVLYSIEYNNTCSFVTNVPGVQNITIPVSTGPQNRLENSYNLPILYFGNNGLGYVLYIDANCNSMVLLVPEISVLLKEENLTTIGDLSALSAIMQESNDYILV